jgi:hypothetical protein
MATPPLSFEGYRSSRNPMAGGQPVVLPVVQAAIIPRNTGPTKAQIDRVLEIRKQNQRLIAQDFKELFDHSVVSYGSLDWRGKRQRLETRELMAEIQAAIGD